MLLVQVPRNVVGGARTLRAGLTNSEAQRLAGEESDGKKIITIVVVVGAGSIYENFTFQHNHHTRLCCDTLGGERRNYSKAIQTQSSFYVVIRMGNGIVKENKFFIRNEATLYVFRCHRR